MHNYITCELDLTSTPFCDTKLLSYDIELSPSGKKIGFNLLNDGDFINILQSLMSLIQPQIHQPFINF